MRLKWSMRLKTFGKLELENIKFRRKKPLLLLTYLAIEGSQDRRYLSEFFWPNATDSFNSLSRALSQLRKICPIEADKDRVWVNIKTDVKEFLQACKANDYKQALEIYKDSFADGIFLNDWGIELEEWVYEKREYLAAKAQKTMLELAEIEASHGRFVPAAELAEKAYNLKSAPLVEPEDFSNYYSLLIASNHELAKKLKEEAREYGIELSIDAKDAKNRLQSNIIGREEEKAKLESLSDGQWAWLQAANGMGKTTLLKSLDGHYLTAKRGLPYATLEAVLGNTISEGKELMLRKLANTTGALLIDGWEWIDPESQELLKELRHLGTKAKIIISSAEKAQINTDLKIELGPIKQKALAKLDKAWEKTEGLPILVGAFLRDEALEDALETRIERLDETAKKIYLALALTDTNPTLVRRALNLQAAKTALAFENLVQAGLVHASGKIRAPQASKKYLASQRLMASQIALLLARELKDTKAFPLYQQAKLLWEEEDLEQVNQAYLAWANELLRRGFPKRAFEVLDELVANDEISFVKAQALERTGLYREALEELEKQTENPRVFAQKGAIYWRLGEVEKATQFSNLALKGGLESRAEAHMTLANLARSQGDNDEAMKQANRAVALWRTTNEPTRLANALVILAVVEAINNKDPQASFAEALEVAKDNPILKSRIKLNQGAVFRNANNLKQALISYQEAIDIAENISNATSARAWNNIGVIHHLNNNFDEAKFAYTKALEVARLTGERRILGMFLANLAELTENRDAWEEALNILKEAGQEEVIEQHIKQLPENHPFRHQT